MGRIGTLFAYEQAGITPDVMALAKGIGGGFPLGAVLATEAVAQHLTPGTHGTTFGGNPLACAAGNAVLDVILTPGFLEDVRRKAAILKAGLEALVQDYPGTFTSLRGHGLLLGLHCVQPLAAVQAACEAEGLLALPASENVLRLAPPLVITDDDCAQALAKLRRVGRTA
jgi:acetylornithine/N-succinyldiaminopimelate aminotransferase